MFTPVFFKIFIIVHYRLTIVEYIVKITRCVEVCGRQFYSPLFCSSAMTVFWCRLCCVRNSLLISVCAWTEEVRGRLVIQWRIHWWICRSFWKNYVCNASVECFHCSCETIALRCGSSANYFPSSNNNLLYALNHNM